MGSHPKVAGIVDAFDVDRGVMLLANVYELVPAVPTDELVSGTRGVRELITMGYDIAEAFDHTHGKRIIHRDMKPANVLVDKNTGRAKLADFGIAAFASELPSIRDPIWGTPIGSARYMSPEQICRQNISYPSDIYSFGAAMYHMLTGEVPVDGKEITDIYYNLQAGNVNRTVSRPDVPEELEWALESLVKAIKDLRQGNKNHRPDAKEALNWFDVLKHDLAA